MGYDMYIVGPLGEEERYLLGEEEPGYFRLNIFGMGTFCEYMYQLGMMVEAPDPGVTGRTWNTKDSKAKGLPFYKFGSNDGWWVRQREIKAALATYDKVPHSEVVVPADDREYWDKWIMFLRVAAVSGGFRVW